MRKKMLFGIRPLDKLYDILILLKGHFKLGDIDEHTYLSGCSFIEDKIDAYYVKHRFPKQFDYEEK